MREYCAKFNNKEYCNNLPNECYSEPLLPENVPFARYYFPFDDSRVCKNGFINGACVPTATGIVKATISPSTLSPKSSFFLAGTRDQVIMAFNIAAENDNIKIRDLVFSGTNLDSLSNFRIKTPTGAIIQGFNNTSTKIAFTNVGVTDTVLKDKTDTYYLVADINTNVNGVTFNTILDVAASKAIAPNGTIL
jgi:hypothetical protein